MMSPETDTRKCHFCYVVRRADVTLQTTGDNEALREHFLLFLICHGMLEDLQDVTHSQASDETTLGTDHK